ncbi:hypothetical protein OU994_23085 [Pseudoduganella sp. SL102]|uniref:hypothetical protein n=1 Tax=Pseudoduganella sp. SL102 TaxID=2995154 RepID=UPI00248AA432|nr:hypothetical protein [Pseudoduganella sp. SL102]WBS01164.1 hypothetical protein OU994_23085 [Pseudoduganella sp. SL102]
MGSIYWLPAVLIGAIALTSKMTRSPAWMDALFAVLAASSGLWLMYRCFLDRRAVTVPLTDWRTKSIRALASSIKSRPSFRFFLLFGMALGSFGVACKLANWEVAGDGLYGASASTLVLAGALDVCHIGRRMLSKAWAPAAGKLLSITIGIALACLALSLAKSATHSITRIDPKYFSEFTTALTAIILPLVYAMAGAILLAAFACIQWLKLALLLTLVGRDRHLWYSAVEAPRGSLGDWQNGGINSSAGPDATLTHDIRLFNDVTHMVRPFALVTVALVFAAISGQTLDLWPTVKPSLTTLLVKMEYRSNSACPNAPTYPVAYMDDDNISVAIQADGKYRFEIRPCGLQKQEQS